MNCPTHLRVTKLNNPAAPLTPNRSPRTAHLLAASDHVAGLAVPLSNARVDDGRDRLDALLRLRPRPPHRRQLPRVTPRARRTPARIHTRREYEAGRSAKPPGRLPPKVRLFLNRSCAFPPCTHALTPCTHSHVHALKIPSDAMAAIPPVRSLHVPRAVRATRLEPRAADPVYSRCYSRSVL